MPEIVYFSGPDYDVPGYLWREEGEVPPCVDGYRLGSFICRCGRHRVEAYMSLDPLDSQDRVACTITMA